MKRRTWIVLVSFLVISLTFGTYAVAEESQSNDYDGIWSGNGAVSTTGGCSGGTIPILFEVKDGLAKSLIKDERQMFETKVKKKGKIKFTYKNAASDSYQTGGKPIDIRFTGKLGTSSGKGSFSYASGSGCRGSWTVSKE